MPVSSRMNSKILVSFVVLALVVLICEVSSQALGPFRLRGARPNLINGIANGLTRPLRPRGGRVSPDFQSGADDSSSNAGAPSDTANTDSNANARKNPKQEKTPDYDLHLLARRLADFDNYY